MYILPLQDAIRTKKRKRNRFDIHILVIFKQDVSFCKYLPNKIIIAHNGANLVPESDLCFTSNDPHFSNLPNYLLYGRLLMIIISEINFMRTKMLKSDFGIRLAPFYVVRLICTQYFNYVLRLLNHVCFR